MKHKLNQPNVPPVKLSGIKALRAVCRSLLLCLPVVLCANIGAIAKHIPGFTMPTCGMAVTVTATPSPACVGNVLSLNATATGGTLPYTYTWTGPVTQDFSETVSTASTTTPPLTIDDGGFYTVVVHDAAGCSVTGLALVSVYSNPVLDVTATPNPVCIGNTLSVTSGFNSGGSGVATYVWTGPNGFTSTAEDGIVNNMSTIAGGIYSVTVTDNHGCVGSGNTANVSVITNTANLSVSGDVSICPGASAELTASGCTTYDWNPSSGLSPTSGSDVIATPGTTTTYAITGHVGNCSNTTNLTVTILAQQTSSTTTSGSGTIQPSSTNICTGADQTYTVTPASGYHIQDVTVNGVSIGHTPPFVVHNVQGPQAISATFAPDCTTPSITATTNGSVCGSGTVSLGATASAGTINWYTASTGGTSINTGSTYSPGVSATTTYYVDATDGSCVSGRTAVTATVYPQPSASASVTNVKCYGAATGAVSVTGSGGTPNYTVTGSATSDLTAGTYNYTLTDANGCIATTSATVSQPSAALSVSLVPSNISCNSANGGTHNDGHITSTVTGGTGAYYYTWTGGAGGAGGANPTGLIAATYNVVVTDDNSCSASASATVGEPAAVAISSITSSDVSCNASNGGNHSDGGFTTAVTGGTGSYTYLWSNGFTMQNPTGLAVGSYNVTVTDAHGCTVSGGGSVGQPSALTVAATPSNVSCNSANSGTHNNGSISLAVTGGSGNGSYTYLWSNGETVSTPTDLTAAAWSVTVTDSKGCTATGSATVGQPTAVSVSAITPANVSCNSSNGGTNNDGSITVTASGGTGSYSYAWSNGLTYSTNSISGLSPISLSVTVSDANGCGTTASATVGQPTAMSATASVTNVSCNAGNNGAVTVNATGGAGGYVVSGSATSSLTAGSYNYTVTDTKGCTTTTSATVTQPSAPLSASSSVTNVACYGNSTGAVTVSATGGTSPYTGTGTFSGKAAGSYNYTVTDANGCTASTSASVTQPSAALSASSSVTNVACYGNSTGAVTVSATGGTSPYTGTGSFTGKTAGSYSYTVTDANGCTSSATASVTQPASALSASSTATNVLCNGNATGSVAVSAAGGTSPYTGTGTFSGKVAGTYNYTVTDAAGCTASTSATITQPTTALSASSSVTNVACFGNSTGSVVVSATGGTSPYTGTGTFTGKAAGSYNYTVTDAHGCTASVSASVSQPSSALSAASSVTNVACYGNSTGAVMVSATGGTSPYTGTGTFSGKAAGSYNYTVTDANGCTSSTSASITQPSAALSASASVTNASCNGGSDGSVVISATGGTSPYTGTGTFNNKSAGTYNYTVTDNKGCTATASAAVGQASAISVTGTVTNVTCNGQSNGSVTTSVSGGTSGYTYSWSTGATTSSITSRAAGTYTLTVTDAHSCTSANTYTITQPAAVVSSITGSNATLGGTTNTYTGPSGMDSYSWSVAGSGASISGSSSSSTVSVSSLCSTSSYTVTLTVVKYTSCSNTASLTVTVTPSSTTTIYSCQYNTGSGYHPTISKSALPCSIKVYDRSVCGARDYDQTHYGSTYASSTGQVTNCVVSDPVLVNVGGGPAYKYTVTVPSSGHYLVLGQSTVSSSRYTGGSCTLYTGSKVGGHLSGDGDDYSDEDDDGGGCTSSITRYPCVLKDYTGKCSEGEIQQQHGSLMLMVSPASLDFTDSVSYLPVVYESVEGLWDVSVSADPPSGFYSTPSDSLSTSVADSNLSSVQFAITDTGSEWTRTKLTHNIFHKGAARVAYTNPKMVNNRSNKPSVVSISPNPANDQINVILPKFEGKATINIYDLLGQKVAEKPVVISGDSPTQMDISSLVPGVYLVTAENSYGKATGRLVKTKQ